MLAILFLNDGTGDDIEGNYKWKVKINDTVLAEGEIKSHNRLSGWQGLVKYFAENIPGRYDGKKEFEVTDFTYKDLDK